jgi:hypothetical protein
MDAQISKRFDYLESVLEADQDRGLFNETKNILLEAFENLEFNKNPDIGVDDSGRSIAEWHNYNGCLVISVIPFSTEKIMIEGIKNNKTTFTIATTLRNLKENNSNSEIS